MALEVRPPDAVLPLETRHGLVPIQQRKKSKTVPLAVTERQEFMSLRRGGLHPEPARCVDVRLKLRAQPFEMRPTRAVEPDDEALVTVIRVCLPGRSVGEARDVAI